MARYELWDLGLLVDASYYPTLNESDRAAAVGRGGHGYEWVRGASLPIAAPAGLALPFDINDKGIIVGFNDFTAFMYAAGGGYIDLTTKVNAKALSSAQAINNSSVVVGGSDFGISGTGWVPVPPIFGYIYDALADRLTDLMTVFPGSHGIATRINESAQVVGIHPTAFLYDKGTCTEKDVMPWEGEGDS